MKTLNSLGGLAVLASLAATGYFAWTPRAIPSQTTEQSGRPVVVHVKGGLIEVSRIQTVETFQATRNETILGVSVGKTVARIRVPVVYRYHVELGADWTVLLRDKTFTVISPPVKPSLPVAIDTGRLEAESSGRWALFTGGARIEDLQRSITNSLAVKAESPDNRLLQRETARQTLREFVRKWLISQERWKAAAYPIRVFFADEPIQSPNTMPQPLIGSL